MKILGEKPTSPFEEMLIGILSGIDRSTDKPETKAIRASAAAAVIMKKMTERNLTVINSNDVVRYEIHTDISNTYTDDAGNELIEGLLASLAERAEKAIRSGEAALAKKALSPQVGKLRVTVCLQVLLPGLEAHQRATGQTDEFAAATHPGGQA